jgi:hypothetical protein
MPSPQPARQLSTALAALVADALPMNEEPLGANPMIAEIAWRSSDKVTSVQELDDVLDRIAVEISPELPQAVNITRQNGDCLTIVLGAKEGSMLSFIAASADPPYFVSLGNPTAKGVFTYFVEMDHHSEALARNVVPESEAREAAREFVVQATGLPRKVTWTEV